MKLQKVTAKGAHNLYRNPDSELIYYRQYKNGKEVLRSTRTKNVEMAKKIADKFRLDHFVRPAIHAKIRRTALELFDEWLEGKRTLNKSSATITSIEASRKHLSPYLDMLFPEEITSRWWAGVYVPEVRGATHAKRKFFNDRKWLLSFLKHLKENNLIAQSPILVNPDSGERRGKVFTTDEVRDLIACSSGDLHLAILMAATMGMRRGEIIGLKWEMLDLKKSTVWLPSWLTKIRRERKFKISERVLSLLKERHSERYSEYVFPNSVNSSRPSPPDTFKRSWSKLKREVGATGRFHDLRHTFLTNAFKAPNANAAIICHYAGLSLEVAERIYLHFDEEDSKKVAEMVSYE